MNDQKVAIVTVGDSEGSQLPSEIFMEIASETRCGILEMLSEKPTHATKIANALELTKQETYRNTTRLAQVGLVKKGVDGLFSLTEYGKAITNQFSFFLFLEKHKKFFETHSLENLPQKFVQRLGQLENTELISNVANVLERLKKIHSGAKDHYKSIVSQGFSDMIHDTLTLLKNKVTIKGIIAKQSVIPDEIMESCEKQVTKFAPDRDQFEIRQIEDYTIAVYVSEGTCAVMFPNKNHQIDMNTMFIGNDESLREWCNDVFEYYWSRSKPYKSKFPQIQVH